MPNYAASGRWLASLLAVLLFCAQPALAGSTAGAAAPLSSAGTDIHIDGAGSTALAQIVSTWIDTYRRLHPSIQISYQPVGSAGGLGLLRSGRTSFAVSDRPVTDADLAGHGRIVEIPVAVHAVVPLYNLPGVPRLRLSGATLADIFLGKITRWNDREIGNDNPGVNLPPMDIKIFHDFSGKNGDSIVMADYLSKVSADFRAAFVNRNAGWPAASSRFKGGGGVMGYVDMTPGSIGYVWEFPSSDLHSGEGFAVVRNADGAFVAATPQSLSSAAAAALPAIRTQLPDFRISIANAPGNTSYPIATFIWFVARMPAKNDADGKAMIDFLKWVLSDGQKLMPKLAPASLPDDVAKLELLHIGAVAN